MNSKSNLQAKHDILNNCEAIATSIIKKKYSEFDGKLINTLGAAILAPSTSGKSSLVNADALVISGTEWKQDVVVSHKGAAMTVRFNDDKSGCVCFTDIDVLMHMVIDEVSEHELASEALKEYAKSYTLTKFYTESNAQFGELVTNVFKEPTVEDELFHVMAMVAETVARLSTLLLATRENVNLITYALGFPILGGTSPNLILYLFLMHANQIRERAIKRGDCDLGEQHYKDYVGTLTNYCVVASSVRLLGDNNYLKQAIEELLSAATAKGDQNEDKHEDSDGEYVS